MQTEKLKSRLGFILLSAGCAIGIGNVWKFPYVVGQNGGGAFVLFYLFFLITIGMPIMTMEFAMGRASQVGLIKAYEKLKPNSKWWRLHSYIGILGNYILVMFYAVVTAWILQYFVANVTGAFNGLDLNGIKDYYGSILLDYKSLIFYSYIVVCVGFFVCSRSLQKGIERITKYMMIALLFIMILLAINGFFVEGGKEGLVFYLIPNFEKVQEIGILKVIVAALNQAFFSLSLGMGAMMVFGSYLNKERALMGESLMICLLDTFVAIASGLIIFPACFAYGVEVNSGPELLFITLPNIFNHMPFGDFAGALFFIFMSFAAFSTIFAIFENIVASTMTQFKLSRKKACLINLVIMLMIVLPCIFGFNIWSHIEPFGPGSTILDLEDFLVSNLIMPLGTIVIVMFCTKRRGWTFENFIEEANTGKGLKVGRWMKYYCKYFLPVVILLLFFIGIYNFFN